MDVAKFIDILKAPRKIFGIAFIFSSFLLFAQAEWLEFLGLNPLIQAYRPFISIAFLVSLSGLLVELCVAMHGNYCIYNKYSNNLNDMLKTLNSLDQKEISVLREFFIQKQNTISLPLNDPIVAGLITKRILVPSGNFAEASMAGLIRPTSINNTIKELVRPELVGLRDKIPSPEELTWAKNDRPEFMNLIEKKY